MSLQLLPGMLCMGVDFAVLAFNECKPVWRRAGLQPARSSCIPSIAQEKFLGNDEQDSVMLHECPCLRGSVLHLQPAPIKRRLCDGALCL